MPADDDVDDVANRYYDIDFVMREAMRDGEPKVLVKWKGYSHQHTSWEPASQIHSYFIEACRALAHQKQLDKKRQAPPCHNDIVQDLAKAAKCLATGQAKEALKLPVDGVQERGGSALAADDVDALAQKSEHHQSEPRKTQPLSLSGGAVWQPKHLGPPSKDEDANKILAVHRQSKSHTQQHKNKKIKTPQPASSRFPEASSAVPATKPRAFQPRSHHTHTRKQTTPHKTQPAPDFSANPTSTADAHKQTSEAVLERARTYARLNHNKGKGAATLLSAELIRCRTSMTDGAFAMSAAMQIWKQRAQAAEQKLAAQVMPECIICFAEQVTHVMVPCGHVCLCAVCADAFSVPGKKCPTCNSDVLHVCKLYY